MIDHLVWMLFSSINENVCFDPSKENVECKNNVKMKRSRLLCAALDINGMDGLPRVELLHPRERHLGNFSLVFPATNSKQVS